MTGNMTLKKASEKWGIGARRINTLCSEGRIDDVDKRYGKGSWQEIEAMERAKYII